MIRLLMITLLVLSTASLSACGKKGPLDPPADDQQKQDQQKQP